MFLCLRIKKSRALLAAMQSTFIWFSQAPQAACLTMMLIPQWCLATRAGCCSVPATSSRGLRKPLWRVRPLQRCHVNNACCCRAPSCGSVRSEPPMACPTMMLTPRWCPAALSLGRRQRSGKGSTAMLTRSTWKRYSSSKLCHAVEASAFHTAGWLD